MTMLPRLHLPSMQLRKPDATQAPPSYDDSQQQWAQSQGDDVLRATQIALSREVPELGELDLGRSAVVLQCLADTPCGGGDGGTTYLERIREYKQLPGIPKKARAKAIEVCNRAARTEENLVLVLSALVLAEYYAPMDNRDACGSPKTQLRAVAACAEEGCRCLDYDCPPRAVESIGGSADWWTFGETPTPKCCCGHPEHFHLRRSGRGVQQMLRQYCDTEREHYRALEHCTSDRNYKTQLSEIMPCRSDGCRCTDYNKARIGVRCVCSHAEEGHATQEVDKTRTWDLSWILVEACYDRLDQLYPRGVWNRIM